MVGLPVISPPAQIPPGQFWAGGATGRVICFMIWSSFSDISLMALSLWWVPFTIARICSASLRLLSWQTNDAVVLLLPLIFTEQSPAC